MYIFGTYKKNRKLKAFPKMFNAIGKEKPNFGRLPSEKHLKDQSQHIIGTIKFGRGGMGQWRMGFKGYSFILNVYPAMGRFLCCCPSENNKNSWHQLQLLAILLLTGCSVLAQIGTISRTHTYIHIHRNQAQAI